MSEEAKISMKLLIDGKNNKVLFAEAGKECVDFFFHLLALPIGTVVKCLTKQAMVGSLGILYDSLENLSVNYLQSNATKDCLLNPKGPALGTTPQVALLMHNQAPDSDGAKTFYRCRHGCGYDVSDGEGTLCPHCQNQMKYKMNYIAPPGVKTTSSSSQESSQGGYVKGVVTYMIMDDLAVKPMSTISSITLLNKFNVKDVGCLVEKTVSLDMKQGIALLKASLMSKAVLTEAFLSANKGA